MRAALVLSAVIAAAPVAARAADLFYMDHDPLTNQFIGAVGPLVISGDIVSGDYDLVLAKIAGDQKRFFEQNKFIVAAEQGDLQEAMKIADLVKSLFSGVTVGPVTGRCRSACFLIYVAASQRATDGAGLIGLEHPVVDQSVMLETQTFLKQNDVPEYLVDEMFRGGSQSVYSLNERDEATLGTYSPAFKRYLADKCAWDEMLERDVYAQRRPFADLQKMSECRQRLTLIDAKKALAVALKLKPPQAEVKKPQAEIKKKRKAAPQPQPAPAAGSPADH